MKVCKNCGGIFPKHNFGTIGSKKEDKELCKYYLQKKYKWDCGTCRFWCKFSSLEYEECLLRSKDTPESHFSFFSKPSCGCEFWEEYK